MTTAPHRWVRVSRQNPCPTCRHPDWCGISANGELVCCMRIQSDRPARNGGWIHRLVEPLPQLPPPPAAARDEIDAPALMARWQHDHTTPEQVAGHAADLGVAPDALRRLGMAWAPPHRAWAFPMRNECERTVGIRLRAEDGRKWAVRGSHSGLFIPQGLAGGRPVLICEGPTDTAAALTLGCDAVGRPSCEGNVATLTAWLCRRHCDEVVILADHDAPGLRGAQKLAAVLPCAHRIAIPPCKDIREWLRLGATHDDVSALIASCQLTTGGKNQ